MSRGFYYKNSYEKVALIANNSYEKVAKYDKSSYEKFTLEYDPDAYVNIMGTNVIKN